VILDSFLLAGQVGIVTGGDKDLARLRY